MHWYDRPIYWFFHWYYRRAALRMPGYAWLLKFTAEEFIEDFDPQHKLESSTRWFYETQRDAYLKRKQSVEAK